MVEVAIFTDLTETPVVYHISDDKTEITNMNAKLQGKNITFTASEFSTYVIATADGVSGDTTTPDTEETPDVGDTTTPDTETTEDFTNGTGVTTDVLAVGDRFTINGVTYEITNTTNKEVKIVSVDSSVTDLTIPETVKPNLKCPLMNR